MLCSTYQPEHPHRKGPATLGYGWAMPEPFLEPARKPPPIPTSCCRGGTIHGFVEGKWQQGQAAPGCLLSHGRALGGDPNHRAPLLRVRAGATQPLLFAHQHNRSHQRLQQPWGSGTPRLSPHRLQPFPLTPPAAKRPGALSAKCISIAPWVLLSPWLSPSACIPWHRELSEMEPFCCLFLHAPTFQSTSIGCQLLPSIPC